MPSLYWAATDCIGAAWYPFAKKKGNKSWPISTKPASSLSQTLHAACCFISPCTALSAAFSSCCNTVALKCSWSKCLPNVQNPKNVKSDVFVDFPILVGKKCGSPVTMILQILAVRCCEMCWSSLSCISFRPFEKSMLLLERLDRDRVFGRNKLTGKWPEKVPSFRRYTKLSWGRLDHATPVTSDFPNFSVDEVNKKKDHVPFDGYQLSLSNQLDQLGHKVKVPGNAIHIQRCAPPPPHATDATLPSPTWRPTRRCRVSRL